MRLVPVLILVAGGLVAACDRGADSTGPTNVTPSPATAQDKARGLVADATRSVCDHLAACAAEMGPVAPDRASCLALAGTFLDLDVPYSKLVAYQLDEIAWSTCVAAALDSCSKFSPSVIIDCFDSALVGTRTAGTCCDGLDGCVAGTQCATGTDGLGLCLPIVNAGDSCTLGVCASGLYCSSDDTCQPLPGLTETCATRVGCADGLYCDPIVEVCKALPGEAQSCADTLECASGLNCNLQDFTCVARPPSYCDVLSPCSDGSVCDYVTSTCLSSVSLGAPCSYDEQCPPGASCVSGVDSATCIANALVDDACSGGAIGDPVCAWRFGLTCTGGSCTLGPTQDEPCTSDDLCQPVEALYCDQITDTCQPRMPVGSACIPAVSGSCLEGAYCDWSLEACVPIPTYIVGGNRCPG